MMERKVGTVVRGVRAPIIREGDDLVSIVVNSVLEAKESEGFSINDNDIIAITEAVVARAQGNYASIDDIAADVKSKFNDEPIGVIFPILSRNRFATVLKGIAKATKKVVLMLSYPSDEVGNHLVDMDAIDRNNINPWSDILSEEQFREYFGRPIHQFTGTDYIEYYKTLITEQGADVQIVFANDCRAILNYTKNVITCDIHTRERTKRILSENNATVIGLDNILNQPVNGSGCNPEYGVLGSNKATETSVKLFPTNCFEFVEKVAAKMKETIGKDVEVMVYGDGAFKDPIGKIWELADPIVSPGYTKGLEGQPSEVKIKYLADNDFAHLSGEELKKAISEYIKNKPQDLVGNMVSQGTTPRRITDLIGSLCDLTSGSGDKGTPIIFIQNYFDNYAK